MVLFEFLVCFREPEVGESGLGFEECSYGKGGHSSAPSATFRPVPELHCSCKTELTQTLNQMQYTTTLVRLTKLWSQPFENILE